MRRIKMKEKIKNQIDNMKNQTIGVEIEMNNITRKKAAELVAERGTQQANTGIQHGPAKTQAVEFGNFKRM